MTDILRLVFRTFVSQPEVGEQLSPPCPTTCSALVVGDPGLGRAVLLLAAVTAASELGVRVMFFTQTQIQSLPVSLQKCVSGLSPESLKRIQFSYPRTLEELLQQVARLHESPHTSPTPPSLILVDRLEGFLCGSGSHSGSHPGAPSRAAHLAALLCDSASFLTQVLDQRSSGSAPCRVIASFQPGGDPGQAGSEASATDPVLDVLDRYFQVRCTLDQDRSYEAAAAGLQGLWHVYLSGTGITETGAGITQTGTGITGTGAGITGTGTGITGTGITGIGTGITETGAGITGTGTFITGTGTRITETGTGITGTVITGTEDHEDRPAVATEWQLLVSPDGSMEFKSV
ncbi:ATPase SWSAP1 [Etheostoma cragini]|uniref:ATPase SWSAP1 n=1 Tax=Etheostoma cragini TaxID=417921 RepID=UPI00155EC50C|nr:ATPase SWSAP1 [Etheostoma cragini]